VNVLGACSSNASEKSYKWATGEAAFIPTLGNKAISPQEIEYSGIIVRLTRKQYASARATPTRTSASASSTSAGAAAAASVRATAKVLHVP